MQNSIKYFSYLKPAIESLGSSNDAFNLRVWAIDLTRQRKLNTMDEGPTTYIGKGFLVGTTNAMYQTMCNRASPSNAYEVIVPCAPAKLYLDIEFKVEDYWSLNSTICNEMIKLLESLIQRHLLLAFPHHRTDDGMIILQSCNEKKFSIHVIHPGYIFDNPQVSMLSYVIELCAYLKAKIDTAVQNGVGDDGLFSNAVQALLKNGILDLSVYKSNQQYRLIGNSKLNQQRTFLLWNKEDKKIHQFQDTDITFKAAAISPQLFWSCLVSCPGTGLHLTLTVRPPLNAPYPSIMRKQEEIYGDLLPECQMNPEARLFVSTIARVTHEADETVYNHPNLLNVDDKDSLVIDDDEYVINEFGRQVYARKLCDGEVVYCTVCETFTYKPADFHALWVREKGLGVPSAKVLQLRTGAMAIYCFNCQKLVVILMCGDQYGFVPEPHEVIKTDNKYLNYSGAVDVDFSRIFRIMFLDAPMGCGKTEVAERFIKDKEKRAVVCLDSIWRLTVLPKYDLVIIDEATFVQYHFLSGTITDQMPKVIEMFKHLLRNTKKIILMQHRIPDATIGFYLDAANIRWGDPKVKRLKLDRPVSLHPTLYHHNAFFVEAILMEHYLSHYDVDSEMSKHPVVVFTTRADHAAMLTWILRKIARDTFNEHAASRIKGIWAQIQEDPWVCRFLTDPNAACRDCDVLVVTSVLQAGHSLDYHFQTSFSFLFNNVLSYREELQFTSRLRFVNRDDIMEHRYAWIETGRTNAKISGMSDWKKIYSQVSGETDTAKFLANIQTPMKSERGDTQNRHLHLHVHEHRVSKTKFKEMDMEEFPFEKFIDWTKRLDGLHEAWSSETGKIVLQMFLDDDPYGYQLTEILNNSNLNEISDLLHLQFSSCKENLYGLVRREPRKLTIRVISNLIGENLPTAANRTNLMMAQYWNLLWLLDYGLYMLLPNEGEEEDDKKRWESRIIKCNDSKDRKKMIGATRVMFKFLKLFGFAERGSCMLSEKKWSRSLQKEDVARLFEEEKPCLEALLETRIDRMIHNMGLKKMSIGVYEPLNSEEPEKKYLSANVAAKQIFKKFGLETNLKNKKREFKNLSKSLTMAACLIQESHFQRYKLLLDRALWEDVSKNFEDARNELNMIE